VYDIFQLFKIKNVEKNKKVKTKKACRE